MNTEKDIPTLLKAASHGDEDALDTLFPMLYAQLHKLAKSQRRRWRGNYTVNTTALVHEAYLKLAKQQPVSWKSQGHFFALSAKAMRHILSDYARSQVTAKRGGKLQRVNLDTDIPAHELNVSTQSAEEMVELDEALGRLEALSKRQANVVECRVFAGLSVQETAQALDISQATVKRDWQLAGAWLRREIKPVETAISRDD